MAYPATFYTRTDWTRDRLYVDGSTNNINTALNAYKNLINGVTAKDQLVNGSHGAKGYYPYADSAYTLGDATYGFVALYMDNSATDGGTIYFNGASTSYLQSSADGATLTIAGFTTVDINTTNVKLATAKTHDIAVGYTDDNVTAPPTDAELDAIWASPVAYALYLVNDNNAGANEYLVWHDGSKWWYNAGTACA